MRLSVLLLIASLAGVLGGNSDDDLSDLFAEFGPA
jgi:hypothetical protein